MPLPGQLTTLMDGQSLSYGVDIGAVAFECIPLASTDPDSVAIPGAPVGPDFGSFSAGSLLAPAFGSSFELCMLLAAAELSDEGADVFAEGAELTAASPADCANRGGGKSFEGERERTRED
jgi:hypothetical protein